MSDLFDYMSVYLLTLLLVILKLLEYISWPWWIVLAPTVAVLVQHIIVTIITDRS